VSTGSGRFFSLVPRARFEYHSEPATSRSFGSGKDKTDYTHGELERRGRRGGAPHSSAGGTEIDRSPDDSRPGRPAIRCVEGPLGCVDRLPVEWTDRGAPAVPGSIGGREAGLDPLGLLKLAQCLELLEAERRR